MKTLFTKTIQFIGSITLIFALLYAIPTEYQYLGDIPFEEVLLFILLFIHSSTTLFHMLKVIKV
ncbi:hypothetical protein UJ101_02558 [Flavobacteriaceae bacterium UJ101]|nr:hypothetical protein UJ101_02558 [Flavobacteriaceae bacterium UJ101]